MSLTPQQEQDRLDRIDQAGKMVIGLMRLFCFEDDLATKHLERAKAHLDEAWIAADGQNARTVEKLVQDIASATAFFQRAAAAKPGGVVEGFGKRWRVGPVVIGKEAQ